MRIFAVIACFILVCAPLFAGDMALNPADLGSKGLPADIKAPDSSAIGSLQTKAAEKADVGEKVKGLVNKLSSTSSTSDQSMAKNQLVKMGDQAVPYLNDAVQNDKRTYTRIQIANILGKTKNESSVPALASTAKSPYPQLNIAAVKNLGEIGGPKAQSALEQLQGATKDKDVLKEIKSSLAKIKGK